MLNIDLESQFPPGCNAILFFMKDDGQYIFAHRKEDQVIAKTVIAKDVQMAFNNKTLAETVWVPENVRAHGYCAKGKWFLALFNPKTVTVTWDRHGDITYPVPPTVLISVKGKHYVFATQTTEITGMTELYHAPYLNVYSGGRICWGSNDFIPSNPDNAQLIWETFITSRATHSNNDKVSKSKTGLLELLDWLVTRKRYPFKDLVYVGSVERTLEKVINA